jgi:hypothetical protein
MRRPPQSVYLKFQRKISNVHSIFKFEQNPNANSYL